MARASAPLRIFNRKVFVGTMTAAFQHRTEPIPVGDFQRLDFAYTIHGSSPNLVLDVSWEHAAQPETANSENWATVGTTLQVTTDDYAQTQGGTTVQSVSGFLPWMRAVILVNPVNSSGNVTWAAEMSLMGHLHRNID